MLSIEGGRADRYARRQELVSGVVNQNLPGAGHGRNDVDAAELDPIRVRDDDSHRNELPGRALRSRYQSSPPGPTHTTFEPANENCKSIGCKRKSADA